MGKHSKPKNKNHIVIFIIIILIIAGIIYVIANRNKIKEATTTVDKIENTENVEIENKIEQEENTTEKENETNNNSTTNTNTSTNTNNSSTTKNATNSNQLGEEESSSQTAISNDEKAISLAKKQWKGSSDAVYFTIDGRVGNTYTVTVRKNTTTNAILIYTVNIDTNEVTEK